MKPIDSNCVKPEIPGYVVLGKSSSDNAYKAIIELSFSMDLSADRCLFFWSSSEANSPLLDALTGRRSKFVIDGLKDAQHHRDAFAKNHPSMTFEIFDVHSDELPIVIDWDEWRRAGEPADTLSGVQDKYKHRNPRFEMRETT